MDLLVMLLAWFGGCAMAGIVVALLLGGASKARRKMFEAWRRGRSEDGD